MDLPFFLRGLIIGFSIAAPVGPIGLLCIQRTLAYGRIAGFVSGLGAATADAVYGMIAAFGLTFISTFLISQEFWLRLVGGLFLCYLGIRTFLAKPTSETTQTEQQSLLEAYTSIFFLTITNPVTILAFVAIFAGLGVGDTEGNHFAALLFVLGVFMGSALWWLLLTGGTSLVRGHFTPKALLWVNWLSGAIITTFGLLALFSLKS